jgi:hypothetical protein
MPVPEMMQKQFHIFQRRIIICARCALPDRVGPAAVICIYRTKLVAAFFIMLTLQGE